MLHVFAEAHTMKRRISLFESWARGEWHHSRTDGKGFGSEEEGIVIHAPPGPILIVKGKIQGGPCDVRPSIHHL